MIRRIKQINLVPTRRCRGQKGQCPPTGGMAKCRTLMLLRSCLFIIAWHRLVWKMVTARTSRWLFSIPHALLSWLVWNSSAPSQLRNSQTILKSLQNYSEQHLGIYGRGGPGAGTIGFSSLRTPSSDWNTTNTPYQESGGIIVTGVTLCLVRWSLIWRIRPALDFSCWIVKYDLMCTHPCGCFLLGFFLGLL